jgi:energy-coupling factor transporter ATP-binding protein EcfA2
MTFVRFAAEACLHIENGTLLLFDEPETHLHPNYITQFVRLLDELLVLSGSFAILATHSAYFVREVPRSQVLVLRESAPGRIDISSPRLKTLGADIGAISFFVFGDELYGRLLRSFQEHFDGDAAKAHQILEQLEGELSSEAVMYLRRELITKREK